jgi:hypothetical protein
VTRLLLAAALLAGASASASADERGDVRAALQLYVQPAPGDALYVVTPSVAGHVVATPWLSFDVDWTADIVTGATPRTYGPPDIVSAATSFSETRNVIGATARGSWRFVTLAAGYSYGTENDYRSHLVHAQLQLDLAHHDTVLAATWSHSFDAICDLAQPGTPLVLRQPLDRSTGCFSGNRQLTEESLDLDTVELSWVQTLSPSWIGTLLGSYQHLDGFQSNPYRTVRLDDGLFVAQESHPRQRHRGAVTARARWAVGKLQGVLGLDLRLYRDTWGIQSLTAEAAWEQPFRQAAPAWRFRLRARGYVQSGAVFYRDAGNADAYDRVGPPGAYFTADQALAPLSDLLVGGRVVWMGSRAERRYWRLFSAMETSIIAEWMKIFALTPEPPNAARTRGWASAVLVGLSATGRF